MLTDIGFESINERRDLIVIMLGRSLQMVTAFAAIRLMTSLLSTEEVGRYYVLLSLTAFFALLLISPVGNYINRKTHDWYRNGTIPKNLNFYWLYLLVVAVFALFVLLILRSVVGIGIEVGWFWLLIVVMGSLLCNTGNVTVTTMLNILGNRMWFVIFTLLTLWVGLGLSFLFTGSISARAEYWLAGLILGQLVFFLVSYRYLIKRLNRSRNKLKPGSLSMPKLSMILPPFHFVLPLAVTAGLWWIQTQSYRFVLVDFGGLEALGLFAIGYGIAASIMAAFESIFDQYYFPIFYGDISAADLESKKIAWYRFATYLFPAVLLVAAFIIACAPYLTKLLVATEFQDSGRFILWGALAELARVLARGLAMMTHAEMKTIWLIPAGVTGAIVALGGVLVLAQWDPQVGTGIALVIAGFTVVLHLAIKLHKELTVRLPWRRIFISIAFSAPLIVGLMGVQAVHNTPTYVQSIIVLSIAGIYLLIAQYLMATQWLNGDQVEEVPI